MLKGSCLCGGVRYEAEGPLLFMARCHCVQCRKASGAEFATNGSVSADTFRVIEGAELLAEYEWSPGRARVFCKRCGSPLFKRAADSPNQVRLRLGSLDSELDQQPLFHVFVSEKPGWSDISDELPRYDKLPA
ncbi:MAG TPA: GFA family protein [Polyangiaceae bacterium]|nr:GFA family protein [Polyangiaceae bacterium]